MFLGIGVITLTSFSVWVAPRHCLPQCELALWGLQNWPCEGLLGIYHFWYSEIEANTTLCFLRGEITYVTFWINVKKEWPSGEFRVILYRKRNSTLRQRQDFCRYSRRNDRPMNLVSFFEVKIYTGVPQNTVFCRYYEKMKNLKSEYTQTADFCRYSRG